MWNIVKKIEKMKKYFFINNKVVILGCPAEDAAFWIASVEAGVIVRDAKARDADLLPIAARNCELTS